MRNLIRRLVAALTVIAPAAFIVVEVAGRNLPGRTHRTAAAPSSGQRSPFSWLSLTNGPRPS
jgi:hypothetical protein